ncbi:MAG: hypothetical protein QUU85_16990, partial [Candidatus Eisenbacteria bacterium]|nr:hypothetical protein [Candidatus Eisenbacteria bacterium]
MTPESGNAQDGRGGAGDAGNGNGNGKGSGNGNGDRAPSRPLRIGVYVCHCGTNIAKTVDVAEVARRMKSEPHVVVSRDYKFMCSDPGQELIQKDIREMQLDRVVVAACSPLMHEPTFRKAVAKAGLNRYLFAMANIREQVSWVTILSLIHISE